MLLPRGHGYPSPSPSSSPSPRRVLIGSGSPVCFPCHSSPPFMAVAPRTPHPALIESCGQIRCLAPDASPASNKTPDQARPNYRAAAVAGLPQKHRRDYNGRTNAGCLMLKKKKQKKQQSAKNKHDRNRPLSLYSGFCISRFNQSRSKHLE